MKKTMFAVFAGMLAMGAAQAQTGGGAATDAAPHFYAGAGIGAAKDSVTGDAKRSLKVFGGYQFDRNWAVETGYADLGKTGIGISNGNGGYTDVRIKSASYYAAARYTLALDERSAVYGKLGLSHGDHAYASAAPGWNFKERTNGVYAAVGLETRLTDRVSLFAEYERNGKRPLNGPRNNVLGAGLKFGF